MKRSRTALFLLVALGLASAAHAASWQYFRIGNKEDIQTRPTGGTAMMGGGDDLDEAFRWLCRRPTAATSWCCGRRGDDDYNSYINGLCKLNSVATLILPDRRRRKIRLWRRSSEKQK